MCDWYLFQCLAINEFERLRIHEYNYSRAGTGLSGDLMQYDVLINAPIIMVMCLALLGQLFLHPSQAPDDYEI